MAVSPELALSCVKTRTMKGVTGLAAKNVKMVCSVEAHICTYRYSFLQLRTPGVVSALASIEFPGLATK